MARKNNFEKTKYKNIISLKDAGGKTYFYANFMLDGVSYQKKNLTKLFNATTAKQASDVLEQVKSDIRQNKNPFNGSRDGKVKDIVLESIDNRKPVGKDTAYKKSIKGFYYNYIDPVIGHLFLDKVNDEHVKKIMKSLEGFRKEYKQNLQILMYRIFEKEFRKGKISHNPFYDLDYGKHTSKSDFDTRLNEPIEDVARKLYKTALDFNKKYRLVLLMSVMLVRRVGELHQIRLNNIKKFSNGDWYILATKDITKSEIEEKYPLPMEIVNLLPLDVLEDEEYKDAPLFDFSMGSILLNYKKLVKEAKIDINEGYSLTSHDNRKMFLSILSFSGTDSDLADRCLSHSGKGGMKQVYLDVPYRIRKEIFEDWWDFLRIEK